MADQTPLDLALNAMLSDEKDEALRLAFFGRFAEAELSILLEFEPSGEKISPQVFSANQGNIALVFEGQHRLSAFTGGPAPYAEMSGRALAQILANRDIGLGLNFGDETASYLIPHSGVDWLLETLSTPATEITENLTDVRAPRQIPAGVEQLLADTLADAGELVDCAYLAETAFASAPDKLVLAIVDIKPPARPALTQSIGEALIFASYPPDLVDVAFISETEPVFERFARVGHRIAVIKQASLSAGPTPPGTYPEKPPKLR